jgi:hypothetical protein
LVLLTLAIARGGTGGTGLGGGASVRISETESDGASAWADALAGGRTPISFSEVIDPQEDSPGSVSGLLSRNFVQAKA